MTKTLPALALSLSLITAPAFAGGLDTPIMEPVIQPQVVETQTAGSSSHAWVVVLLSVLTLGAIPR